MRYPVGVVAMLAWVIGGPTIGVAQEAESSETVEQARERTAELLDEYAVEIGESRSLEELMAFAEANAPEIREAGERVRLGEAAIEGAEKVQPFNPEIEGEVGVGLDDPGLRKVEATLQQRLEVTGERGRRLEVARRRKEMLEARLAAAKWEVHQQVHRLYRLGLVDRKRVELARRSLEFSGRVLRIANERFEAGETPRTSVAVTRAEMATAQKQLVERWTDYTRTLRELGTTIGWDGETPPQPSGELPPPRSAPPRDNLVERAIAHDPRLTVLRARRDLAASHVESAKGEVWPNPLVGAGYERENIGTPSAGHTLRLVVGLPLPIWNRNQGEIAEARARTAIVRRQIENRERVIANRVAKHGETVEATHRAATIYDEQVLPALDRQLALLREGFELGELNLLDVMNARDRLLEVQRDKLETLEEYYRAVNELEQLLGTSIWDTNEDEM